MLKTLLVMSVVISCKTARTEGDAKYITVAQDDPERFVNGKNILIKRVHEKHWDIYYQIDESCPASRKTAETDQLLREYLEEGVRAWLAPLKEITNKPIVDNFAFHKGSGQRDEYEISVKFWCKKERSVASRDARTMDIKEDQGRRFTFKGLPYDKFLLLHELGHVFDLADTYVGNITFSPPSAGGLPKTIGNQPQSVMSIDGGCYVGLCLDDKRAIQWLYRYHYEGLDPKNCPPEFVYEELVHDGKKIGGCVYKNPLLTEIRQGHAEGARRYLKNVRDIEINNKDEHGYSALNYIATLPPKPTVGLLKEILKYPGIDVNVTDKYGNSPLHWATWFGQWQMVYWLLFTTGHSEVTQNEGILLNTQNNYGETALHYASRLGRKRNVFDLLERTDIKPNIKEHRAGNPPLHEAAKNGHTEIVKMLLAHDSINLNIRNRAGKTAKQLAELNGYEETVKAFE